MDREEEDNTVSLTERMREVERTNKPVMQELEARQNHMISSGLYARRNIIKHSFRSQPKLWEDEPPILNPPLAPTSEI